MRVATIAILGLSASLVATNVWWAYHSLDAGITASYAEASMDTESRFNRAAMLVLPLAAQGDGAEAAVKAEVAKQLPDVTPFEKDGYLWVDELGLRFNEAGRLIAVSNGDGGEKRPNNSLERSRER